MSASTRIDIPVRCCCDRRLLGFIKFWKPIKELEHRRYFTFFLSTPLPTTFSAITDSHQSTPFPEKIDMEIAIVNFPDGEEELAFKSQDYPIEKVKRIIGFRLPTKEEMVLEWAKVADLKKV